MIWRISYLSSGKKVALALCDLQLDTYTYVNVTWETASWLERLHRQCYYIRML